MSAVAVLTHTDGRATVAASVQVPARAPWRPSSLDPFVVAVL